MHIKRIEVFQVELPLLEPYHLAFGDLDAFSMILVRATNSSGVRAYGEATANPGYSSVTIDDMWKAAVEAASILPGMSVADALAELDDLVFAEPEKACALVTALESLAEPERFSPNAAFSVPLLATVNATGREAIIAEVHKFLKAGYTTLKVKAGWDIDKDIARVRLVQEIASCKAAIRIDANQGYSEEQAAEFVQAIPPEGIELFEQPFAANDWEAMARLKGRSPLPLMLDESIHDESDLLRAIRENCADFVKFKLSKAGSLRRLGRLMERAYEGGLGVVVGNGVAGEIGCYAEASLMRLHPVTAGENNGFAKLRIRLAASSLGAHDGRLEVPHNFLSGIDPFLLQSHTTRQQVFE